MKHTGRTPAIYASPRRAYLVQTGQAVPPRSRLVISHADLTVLALAFGKSTNGNLDGTREPCLGGLRSYEQNAEAVLQRVANAKIEEVNLPEFRVLRHALGSSHLSASQPDLGWRNYFQIDVLEGQDGDAVSTLVSRGLMEEFKKGYYRATARGMALAGAPA